MGYSLTVKSLGRRRKTLNKRKRNAILNRRQFLNNLGAMAAVFILLGYNMLSQKALAEAKSLKGSRPNIIFVLNDDQGMGLLA